MEVVKMEPIILIIQSGCGRLVAMSQLNQKCPVKILDNFGKVLFTGMLDEVNEK